MKNKSSKKLYQKVKINNKKGFGNQNTNSINVIVNPKEDEESNTEMSLPPALINKLNAISNQGLSGSDMGYMLQQAKRQGEKLTQGEVNQQFEQMKAQEVGQTLDANQMAEAQQQRIAELEQQNEQIASTFAEERAQLQNAMQEEAEKQATDILTEQYTEHINQINELEQRFNEEKEAAQQVAESTLMRAYKEAGQDKAQKNAQIAELEQTLKSRELRNIQTLEELNQLEQEVERMQEFIRGGDVEHEAMMTPDAVNSLTTPPPMHQIQPVAKRQVSPKKQERARKKLPQRTPVMVRNARETRQLLEDRSGKTFGPGRAMSRK